MRSLLTLLLLLPLSARAELTIFDVRKNLPMSDSDPVYRDFIINGGSEAGLSVGTIFTVQRRIPLYDSYQNRSAGDLQLRVAKVKIIQVQKGLAVARLHSEFTRESTPIIEENYIMVGDTIDLSSAGSDKKAEAPAAGETKEPTATAEPPTTAKPTAATVTAPPQTTAQIVVNTVDLSSKSAKAPPPTPEKTEVPTLQ